MKALLIKLNVKTYAKTILTSMVSFGLPRESCFLSKQNMGAQLRFSKLHQKKPQDQCPMERWDQIQIFAQCNI